MSKSNCNLCLAESRRTINIINTHLQTLYEKLANFKVSQNLSLWLCYICHTRLKQCQQLSQLAKQTRCFLSTGLLQTNIKLKSDRMGLVNLSRSTTSHFAVPNPANSNSIVEVLVKKEPLSTLGDLVFDDEALEQYEDMGSTEDWHSYDNKEYTKEGNFGNDNSYADHKDMPCFKNKVEIEINTHSGTNDAVIKEEIVHEIKKEIVGGDKLLNVAAIPDTLLYTCHLCSHMFSTMSLLRKHKITHNTSRLNLKDKSCIGKKVVCPICGKYYADGRVLARHQKIHLAVRPFSCEICNKTFSRRDHYNKHAQTHPGLHLYTCQNCNTHFPNGGQLKAHECTPQEYDPASYSCDICNERFDRWDLYHAHKTDAHGISLFPDITIHKVSRGDPSKEGDDSQIIAEKCHDTKISKPPVNSSNTKQNKKKKKKYSCDTCNTHYSNHYQMETHVLAKHKKARYECDHCDKVFLRRGNLCLHMRTHAGERRYCCDACGKTFTYKSSLNTHWRVHTGVKPYACDLCSKKFTAFGQLAEHKLVHTDVRPFSCEVCSKAFKRRRHLKKHMMSHTGEKPYTCDVCFKSFARNDNYTIHRRIHTGEKPFVCDVCGSTFSENRHLKKHKIIHE